MSFAIIVGQSVPSVNKQIVFSDYLTENITKSRGCLRSFHNALISFKETNSKIDINYN